MGPGLGKRLTAAGLVDRGRLAAALALSTAEPMSMVEALTRLGVDAELIVRLAHHASGAARVDRATLGNATSEALSSLPPSFVRRRLAFPRALDQGVLVLVCADPLDQSVIDEAMRLARRPARAEVASVPDLLAAIRSLYGDLPLPKARPTFVLGNRASGAVPFESPSAPNQRAGSASRPSMLPASREPSSSNLFAIESSVTALDPPVSEFDALMRWDVAPRAVVRGRPGPGGAPGLEGGNSRRRYDREARQATIPTEDLGAVLASIRSAPSRDRVFELLLAATLHHARQSFVFRLRDQRLEGVDSIGSSLGAMAVRRIVLPLSHGSTPHRVVVDGQPHYGPLGVGPTDQVLRAALGSRGGRLSVHGLWIAGRAVGVLVADDLRTGEIGHERLGAACHAAGLALERLVRDRV